MLCVPAALLAAVLGALSGCRHPGFPDVPAGYREFAYVANAGDNTVTVLDLVYLRPDRTLLVGKHPVAVLANPERNEVYVLNEQPGEAAGSFSVIDTAKNAVVATIATHRRPVAMALDPAGKRLFVAQAGANAITVFDVESRRALGTWPAGQDPEHLAVAPDGRTLVVANQGTGQGTGNVSVFSVEGGGLTPRATFAGCAGAAAVTVLPNSQKAFVACSGARQVMALSLAVAPDSYQARQDSSATADHVLTLLDVGARPTSLALKHDGGEVFVSNSDSHSISEIATTPNEVGSTYAIGDKPGAGVISRDDSALWVANSGGGSISLYSIADGQFISSLPTGAGPCALAFSADEHLLLAADRNSGDVALIRTASALGPALFTLMPAGREPCALAIKAMQARP